MPTVEVAPRGPRPPIRVRPVPRCDPPFDDELDPRLWADVRQLAFEWPVSRRPQPAVHQPLPLVDGMSRQRLLAAVHAAARYAPSASAIEAALTGQCSSEHEFPDGDTGPGRRTPTVPADVAAGTSVTAAAAAVGTAREGLSAGEAGAAVVGTAREGVFAGEAGDAKLAVRRFVHMCVEVLNGYRPAAHLRRLALPKEAPGVVAQAVEGMRRVAELRHDTRAGHRRERKPRPVGVLRLHHCEPRPGAVEAAILLVTGERTWAMALRLELHQQTWFATALRLV
jgi:Family of unknown function (DUF6459)